MTTITKTPSVTSQKHLVSHHKSMSNVYFNHKWVNTENEVLLSKKNLWHDCRYHHLSRIIVLKKPYTYTTNMMYLINKVDVM